MKSPTSIPIVLYLTSLVYYSSLTTALPFFTNSTAPENLSPVCFQAITADVAACSPGVAALRRGGYYPQDFLETICSSTCASALSQFRVAITTACAQDSWTGYEEAGLWPLVLIPDMLIYNYEAACLRDGADNQSGNWCNVVGADYAYQLDPQAGHPVYGTAAPRSNTTHDDCELCFIKRLRQQVGSPYYEGPELRSSSVYESRTSRCTITGYPLTTTDAPPITITTTTTVGGESGLPGACTGTKYEIQSGDTCQSISISKGIGTAWLLLDNDLTAACADFPTSGSLCIVNTCSIYTAAANDTCESIATHHNITLAQLKSWNPVLNSGCYNLPRLVGDQLCVSVPGRPYVAPTTTIDTPTAPTTPAPVPTDIAEGTNTYCGRYHKAVLGEYCNLIVIKYGITFDNFAFLNQEINSNCTNLLASSNYCVQPVGDINTYSGHPNSPTAGASLTPVTLTRDLAATLPDATWTPPPSVFTELPLAPNTRPECDTLFNGAIFASAADGVWRSKCELAAKTFGVQLEELEIWNPSLGNISSPDCAFDSAYQYCGKYFFGSRPTENFFELATKNGTLTRAQGCLQLVDIDMYDCTDILQGFNISMAQFYSWNTNVKSDCSGLEGGYQYCVALDPDFTSSTTIGTTGSPTATGTLTTEASQPTGPPGQVQDGQPTNCNKWHLVASGENCGIIENIYFITHSQFLVWNPSVSENCTSGLWPNYYYCVGTKDTVSSTRVSSPILPTTTQTPIPAPEPHQENNAISSCNEYAQTQDGDSCWLFAERNSVALAELYAWNAVLGSDGSGCGTMLWATYWYCVGVYV